MTNLKSLMNLLTTGIILTAILSAGVGIALAEDIDQTKAKVGQSDTFVSWKRENGIIVMENRVECTKVSTRRTVCYTYDNQGWLETMHCDAGNNCRVTSSR
jgi:hypothetical protein